jgi:phage terminase large subunit
MSDSSPPNGTDVWFPDKFQGLFEPRRYHVLWGGRGSGKSWGVARALILKAIKDPIRVLCARETQKSIQDSVHWLLKKQIGEMGLDWFFDVQESKIIGKNGSDFAFAGIKQQSVVNIKSFEGCDVCWVEEAQVVTKKSWDVLIPTIRKPGSEFFITMNPELDTDETYTRFIVEPPENAIVQRVNWDDNPWFNKEMDDERLLMSRRDPIGYRTVWEGECRPAVEGAIYARELDALLRGGRFAVVSHDSLLKTHTVWDLGWNDQTVILMVQRAASELRIVGALIRRFSTYEADIQALKDWASERPGLQWGTDFLPHDAKAQTKTAGGRTGEQIVKALGRTVEIVPNLTVEEGIKQVRTAFPRLWIDKSCQDWLNAIKRYHRQVSTDGAKTGLPVHDDASHGADALRYLAIVAEKLNNHSIKLQKLVYNTKGIV